MENGYIHSFFQSFYSDFLRKRLALTRLKELFKGEKPEDLVRGRFGENAKKVKDARVKILNNMKNIIDRLDPDISAFHQERRAPKRKRVGGLKEVAAPILEEGFVACTQDVAPKSASFLPPATDVAPHLDDTLSSLDALGSHRCEEQGGAASICPSRR